MMGIGWLVIIGLVIYLVNNNSSNIWNSNSQVEFEKEPIEIARKRYAQGEINKEEFQDIREQLKN